MFRFYCVQVLQGHQQSSTDHLSDFCDGSRYLGHPLFGVNCSALQIILYFDELELILQGSEGRSTKLVSNSLAYHLFILLDNNCFVVPGAFYFLLGNLHPKHPASLWSIQPLALVKYSIVSTYGINRIMEPIVEDVKKLEAVSYYYLFQTDCEILE